MIQFLLKNNWVGFAVDLPATQQAGLAFSRVLLKVAVYVKAGPEREGKR